jgi:hypothetical protein
MSTTKAKTVDVPARGRKWVTGALVRDRATQTLYRVAGKPVRYHEDCLSMQRVSKVRELPAEWQATMRLLAIMDQVRSTGTHTPSSRGAYGRPAEQVAEQPVVSGESMRWEARQDAQSYASYPTIEIRGDMLCYVEPIYDDSPTVVWLRDAALAEEARALIAAKPSLCRYPAVHVRG